MFDQAKLSTYAIKKIIKHFRIDIPASKTTLLVSINRNMINRYYNWFRSAIYAYQMHEFGRIIGEAEVDESYFGARRIKKSLPRRRRGFSKKSAQGKIGKSFNSSAIFSLDTLKISSNGCVCFFILSSHQLSFSNILLRSSEVSPSPFHDLVSSQPYLFH